MRGKFLIVLALISIFILPASNSLAATQNKSNLVINLPYETDSSVTGTYIPNYLIRVYSNTGGLLGQGIVNAKGDFAVPVTCKLSAGMRLNVTYKHYYYDSESYPVTVQVQQKTPKVIPVNPISTKPNSNPIIQPIPTNPVVPQQTPTVPTKTTTGTSTTQPVIVKPLPTLPYIKPITNGDFHLEGKSNDPNHNIVVKIGNIKVAEGYSNADCLFSILLPAAIVPNTTLTITETSLTSPNWGPVYVTNLASSDVVVGQSKNTGPKPIYNNLKVDQNCITGSTEPMTTVSFYTLDGVFTYQTEGINYFCNLFLFNYHLTHPGTNIYVTFIKPYGQVTSLTLQSK